MAQTIISLLYYEGKDAYVKKEQKVSNVKKDGEEVEEGTKSGDDRRRKKLILFALNKLF